LNYNQNIFWQWNENPYLYRKPNWVKKKSSANFKNLNFFSVLWNFELWHNCGGWLCIVAKHS